MKKFILSAFFMMVVSLLVAQEQQTLFKNSKLRGGFGGPIYSWSNTKNRTGYGVGGGGGVVFDRGFVGAFGMGETFDAVKVGEKQLAMGYGGLWLGYTAPSFRILHPYASIKLAVGSTGVTDFKTDPDLSDNNWEDVVFVGIPEVGLELNIARWMRISGSAGYRLVSGFEGYGSYGKRDLNAPMLALTMRFGWFGK